MTYRIGTYHFSNEREYKAGLRDAGKIKSISACEGDDFIRSGKILETIKKENIIFETKIGEEFVKKVRSYVNEESRRRESNWKQLAKVGRVVLISCILAVLVNQYLSSTVGDYKSQKSLDALVQEKEKEPQVKEKEQDSKKVSVKQENKKDSEVTGTKKEISGDVIQKEYKKLWEQNHDLAGWLTIENTPINYPVMLHPKDNDYYLKRNFKKENDKNGLLVLDNRCDIRADGGQSIIYGHNMKSGAMFGELLNYKDKAYYQYNTKITYDTLYKTGEYEIIAVFLTKVFYEDEDTFKFYEYTNFQSEEEFDLYIKSIKELSLYDIDATAQYGDSLIALTTCEYSQENGRIVVVARNK